MSQVALGEDATRKFEDVPLSNNAAVSRIEGINHDALAHDITGIKSTPIQVSLQQDESTNINNMSQLLLFIRFVEDMSISDEYLPCKKLSLTTNATDAFRMLNNFLKTQEISWNSIASIFSNGAASMLQHKSGFVSLVKEVVPDTATNHCALHRQRLPQNL